MRGASAGGSHDRPDVVEGVVERRPDQIVHRRVDDDEVPGVAFLHVDHFGDQDAGIADDQPARLEHHLEAELRDMRFLTISA